MIVAFTQTELQRWCVYRVIDKRLAIIIVCEFYLIKSNIQVTGQHLPEKYMTRDITQAIFFEFKSIAFIL